MGLIMRSTMPLAELRQTSASPVQASFFPKSTTAMASVCLCDLCIVSAQQSLRRSRVLHVVLIPSSLSDDDHVVWTGEMGIYLRLWDGSSEEGNKASLLLLKNNNGNGRAGAGARVSSEGETPARGPAQPLPTGDIPAAEIAIKDTSAAAVGGGGSLRLTLNEREPEETRSARGSGPEQQGTVSVIKVDGRLPPLLAPLRPPEVEKIITGQKEGEKKNQNSGADAGGATETNLKGGGADNDIAPLTDVTVAGGEEREELGIEVVATAAAVSPKKSQREKEETCLLMMASLNIEPDRSWGKANKSEQKLWDSLMCNSAVHQVRTIDCTERPSLPMDPLIAICAGTTTRGVPFPNDKSLALFRFLLPSIGQTVECGFNYLAVIGYDVGDEFFDSRSRRDYVFSWFDAEVAQPAASRGINVMLELVRVDNNIQKPGPVFTAITKVAYELGANYIFRVNDDSELVSPWARKFVDALEAMGPPYGVVGPQSLNSNILVHDFTHRLHMVIFDEQYYPAPLTDWYVDDWISRVYGNARTIRAKNVKVEHHTGAHGQRYNEDTSKAKIVDGLISEGATRIAQWAKDHGHEQAALQILSDPLDGKSAKKFWAQKLSR